MIPVLYASNETVFTSYGIGALTDAVTCVILQEINGQYELTMQYPITGIHYDDIGLRSIIKAKPDRITDGQLFRIYRITKPLNGIVTIYARHIAYDLSGIAASPYTAQGLLNALAGLTANAAADCPFSFLTDKSSEESFEVLTPSSIWKLLGDDEGCILSVYGGEYEFDNFDVKLSNRRGTNRNVSVRYGKNMTSLEQDANIANCYTAVYPFYRKENSDGTAVYVGLPEKTVSAPGTYDYTRILVLDLTSEFDEQPTEDQLRQVATEYIENNDIGVPEVTWKVEFISLDQSEEYAGAMLFESVYLGDDVLVEFKELGVDATSRVIKIEYNVLLDRYNYVTLGSVKNNIADTIITQKKEIEKKPTKTMVENIVETLASTILGVNGGSVRLLDTNEDGEPDTLYIADDPDPAKAVKVWRWNYEGWAASQSGYNGPFVFGATLADGILADAVTAAHLTAGTIQSEDEQTFLLDLTNGAMTLTQSQTYEGEEYSTEDITRVRDIILGTIIPTDDDYAKYDINKDGQITNSDLVLVRNIVNYGTLTYAWKAALDPTNRAHIFKIWKTLSYANGTQSELVIFDATSDGATVKLKEALEVEQGGTGAKTGTKAQVNLGLYNSGSEIPSNVSLNDYTQVGKYTCTTDAAAASLAYCPTTSAFTLEVFNLLGTETACENAWQNFLQKITTHYGDVYTRRMWTGESGTRNFGEWVFSGETNLLWSGSAGTSAGAQNCGKKPYANNITVMAQVSSSSSVQGLSVPSLLISDQANAVEFAMASEVNYVCFKLYYDTNGDLIMLPTRASSSTAVIRYVFAN